MYRKGLEKLYNAFKRNPNAAQKALIIVCATHFPSSATRIPRVFEAFLTI